MMREWLAFLGVLVILASTFLGLAWSQYWKAMSGSVPDLEEMGIWQFVQSNVGLTPEQAFVLSLVGLLVGVALTIPWWRERLLRENIWWEKRDEPLDKPPRVS